MTERTGRRRCGECGENVGPNERCAYMECPMRNPVRNTGDALGTILAEALKANNGEAECGNAKD